MIAAAQKFVCVRLATYENKEEAQFLESIFTGRSGELENTTFVILAPDGKARLTRAGRGPMFAFRGAADMAEGMERIAKRYPGKRGADSRDAGLPVLADVRLAVNVAACDRVPLVITYGPTKAQRKELEKRLAPLAWSNAFVGRFAHVFATDADELKAIEDAKEKAGYLVVEPDPFGLEAKVLVQIDAGADEEAIEKALTEALQRHRPGSEKDTRRHRQQGRRAGVHWETEIPVTDPGRPPGGRGPGGR